jgi:hypothetical protein
MVEKIVSGGQTGVDRAALDVALELNIPCGGWCPAGRRAEDGRIPDRYPLIETPAAEYRQRTEWNVRDSDGTLILTRGLPTGGTRLTIEVAKRLDRPYLVVDLNNTFDVAAIKEWITTQQILILNVAGPREEEKPDVARQAAAKLRQLLLADES